MRISVTEAKGQLTELVRRAESGDEVILTRYGQEIVHLVPIRVRPDKRSRRALLQSIRTAAALKSVAGQAAAENQDFLYNTSDMST